MITNKPVIGESASSLEVEARLMSGGDEGNKFEYMNNIPLGNSSALDLLHIETTEAVILIKLLVLEVLKNLHVLELLDTVRANGLVVGSSRAGFQAGADLICC
jgi:hypothetical protein